MGYLRPLNLHFHYRGLVGGGGVLTISKTMISIFTKSDMCILRDVLIIFQLDFKNSHLLPFYIDFKIKSRNNRLTNINVYYFDYNISNEQIYVKFWCKLNAITITR